MGGQEQQVEDLEQRGQVEIMNAEERGRGAGDKNSDLVEGVVGRVEGAEMLEWGTGQGEEQRGRNTLIDGVFGNVDEEEWEHAVWDP